MAYDFNGTTQHLEIATAIVTAAPLTISAWVFPRATASEAIVSIGGGDAGSLVNEFTLMIVSTKAWAVTQNSASNQAVSTTTITTNTWWHLAAVFTSSTSRTIYVNGVAENTNTVSRVPNTAQMVRTRIAQRANNVNDHDLQGNIADVGTWNDTLSASEIESLAKGMTCDKVRPQSLVFYAPLVRNLIDCKGALTINNINSATVAAHPRIYV